MTGRAVVLALVALVAAPALADKDKDPTGPARAHFLQGGAFFQIGEWDRALAEYQKAYDLSGQPTMIFNIALCHDRANRPEQALEAYRRYLALVPTGAVAVEAREDIARLTLVLEKIAADRAAVRAAEDERRRQREREEAARRAAAARAAADERRTRVTWYIAAPGAAVALAGATLHVLAWRTRGGASEAPDYDIYADRRDTVRLERNIAYGAYAAGALTIATGLIVGRLMRSEGPEISAALVPGGAAVAVRWSR